MKRPQKTLYTLLFMSMAISAPSAHAQQHYKCVKGGTTLFQDTPCDAGYASSIRQTRITTGELPWEGLRHGMSPEEVKRVVSVKEEPGDGPKRLRKFGVVIAGTPFNVTYNFDISKQLYSVVMQRSGEYEAGLLQLSRNEENRPTYEKLVAFLRKRYGTETSNSMKSKDTGFPGLSADAEWAIDGGKVFLYIMPVTADTSDLSLGIQLAKRSQ